MIRNQKVHDLISQSEYLKGMYHNDAVVRVAADISSSEVEFIEYLVRSMRGALSMCHDAMMKQTPIIYTQQPAASHPTGIAGEVNGEVGL